MINLTISLDEVAVRDARLRAIREGTSVSAKLREFLVNYAQGGVSHALGQDFLDIARSMQTNYKGAKWSREDAYDRIYPGNA